MYGKERIRQCLDSPFPLRMTPATKVTQLLPLNFLIWREATRVPKVTVFAPASTRTTIWRRMAVKPLHRRVATGKTKGKDKDGNDEREREKERFAMPPFRVSRNLTENELSVCLSVSFPLSRYVVSVIYKILTGASRSGAACTLHPHLSSSAAICSRLSLSAQ